MDDPLLYDNGGPAWPTPTRVVNTTGKPERVLTYEQLQDLQSDED